jgi:hypothetical protein
MPVIFAQFDGNMPPKIRAAALPDSADASRAAHLGPTATYYPVQMGDLSYVLGTCRNDSFLGKIRVDPQTVVVQ